MTTSCALGFAQDRRFDVVALDEQRLRRLPRVEANKAGQGALGLGADDRVEVGRDNVDDVDGGVEVATEGRRETQRQLGVRSAADRGEDPPDSLHAALLDHADVARTVAHDLVDGRRETASVVRRPPASRPSRR
jgi:hypothetical protein